MADAPAKTELEQIAAIFARHGVEYLIIGGQAEVLHGSPRITYDIDFCYRRRRENFPRLAAALQELQCTLRGAPKDLPFILDARTIEMGNNFTFDTPLIDLDLLGYVEPIGTYEELRPNAVHYPSHGIDLWAISVEDLLRIKRHINRLKDQESIYQLLAIQRIRSERSNT
ncbi:MAG TPA: hypothetical protein VH253_01515 [Phycisphaerae bacterium]|nr:hypothetical protein [Phycisphaerae bacterium]